MNIRWLTLYVIVLMTVGCFPSELKLTTEEFLHHRSPYKETAKISGSYEKVVARTYRLAKKCLDKVHTSIAHGGGLSTNRLQTVQLKKISSVKSLLQVYQDSYSKSVIGNQKYDGPAYIVIFEKRNNFTQVDLYGYNQKALEKSFLYWAQGKTEGCPA